MPTPLTVMTYNVHSCIGTDGKVDPIRTAQVIAANRADIVALQELDMGLVRTGLSDQAREIAGYLTMHYHFHPSFGIEKGHYGNAVLSRFPMRIKKAAELPTLPSRKTVEKRGALWVEISIEGEKLQVVNTHLGLNRQERLAQAETLLSAEWLNNPACHPPVILCGDLNIISLSKIYRWLTVPLKDTFRDTKKKICSTYPARIPLLRLDYIFSSPDIKVKEARVAEDRLSHSASDHLPVVVKIELP